MIDTANAAIIEKAAFRADATIQLPGLELILRSTVTWIGDGSRVPPLGLLTAVETETLDRRTTR